MKQQTFCVLRATALLSLLGLSSVMTVSSPARAQAGPPGGAAAIDPRLAGPTVTALQGLLAMREAQLRALHEDTDKTIADLRAKCGDACKEPAPQAAGAAPSAPAPEKETR